ncbi:UNVERIFIED_CONTAM: hypothetical protein Scaly_3117500 [Sesamum calycinum]|uniref:Uncharacterized protein n=1 Tax=Sesamum calycinum TaxID=2727403 RepID=A0AAW2JJK5_9LAMI
MPERTTPSTTRARVEVSTTTGRDGHRRGIAFGPAAREGAREASVRPPAPGGGGGDAMRDAQADVPWPKWLRAQLAFKDSMVHGILQFTPSRISLRSSSMREPRYPLPRVVLTFDRRPLRTGAPRTGAPRGGRFVWFSLARSAPGFVSPHGPRARALAGGGGPGPPFCWLRVRGLLLQVSTMILPQVHLRKPCYDFSFL